MLRGRGGGGKPQPESGCSTASYKPPTTTGFMVTGSSSVRGNGGYPQRPIHHGSGGCGAKFSLKPGRIPDGSAFRLTMS
jgi:hypothetical protein